MLRDEPQYQPLFKPSIEMDTKIDPASKASLHLYYDNDNPVQENGNLIGYPSVTSILDLVSYNVYLMRWANSLGFRRLKYEDELNKAAELGTYLHAMAQKLIDPEHSPDIPTIKDPLVEYYVKKRIQCLEYRLKSETWETIGSEIRIISHKHKVAGTLDWMSMFGNKLTLSDFKSSKTMKEKFLLQLGGYYVILRDDYDIIPEQGQILLCKEDRTIIHGFDQQMLEAAGDAFLHLLDYHVAHQQVLPYITKDRVLQEGVTGQ